MVATATRTILENLDRIPDEDERTKIAIICYDVSLYFFSMPVCSFLTYFWHFLNVPFQTGTTDSTMLVVSDIEDVFLPKPNDLLVNIAESRASLEALLGRIGDMFQDNSIMGSAMGPALQAGFKLMVGIFNYLCYFVDWLGFTGTYWWKNHRPVFDSPFCRSRFIEKQRRPQNLGYFQGKLCVVSLT